MRKPTVEERLAKLEEQMKQMLDAVDPLRDSLEPGPDEWKLTAGIFDKEDGMDEVFQEEMNLREAERRKFRRMLADRKPARTSKVM